MDGQGQGAVNPQEVIMKLVETLGMEMVIRMLTDDQFAQQVSAFADVIKQMQPEQKAQLAQQIQGMGGGGQEAGPVAPEGGSGQMFAGAPPAGTSMFQ